MRQTRFASVAIVLAVTLAAVPAVAQQAADSTTAELVRISQALTKRGAAALSPVLRASE
jgi:hypothetical protein